MFVTETKNLVHSKGNISIFVLVFGVVFSTVIGGLVIYGAVEQNNVSRSEASNIALSIAEAGINYYRWHLAHDPIDFQDGTGQPGPYEHPYQDPQSGNIGTFSLEIIPPEEGSETVTINSTGWSDNFPLIKRTVSVRYGPEPLTKFSFLHNANVWFGQGITVYGEVFSNGGIRFDGINESVVKSVKETYTCGSETGCNTPQTRPGIWGSGGPTELWEFPVTLFDFDSIVTDFSKLKLAAQNTGVYLPSSPNWGYRLIFQADGSVQVYTVTSASNKKGWSVEEGCENLYQTINGQTLLGSYSLDDKKVIYAEDTLWVEGVVDGSVTVVAARLPVDSFVTNIFINDSLTYENLDGSSRLGLIAQNDIIFAYDIPQTFEINAAMLAQNGKILRHLYSSSCTNGSKSRAIRQNLIIFGSVISNKKSYWNFSGAGGVASGFINREITYDQLAVDVPPPYFPTTDIYKILSWDEKN